MSRRGTKATLNEWIQYLGLRGSAALIQCFDLDQNLHTAASIGRLYAHLARKRRTRAIENIQRCFPEMTTEQAEGLAIQSVEHLFQLFILDSLAMPRLLTPASWPEYVQIGKLGSSLDMLLKRQPAIFITGHCGNWELLGYTLSLLGFPMSALARPIDNPLVNDWFLGVREARGMEIITKWGGTEKVQKILRSGGRIGFIADQNAGDDGLFVPFFNRLASSYKSIGLLAMRYKVPIVAGLARRLDGRFKYELAATDFIWPQDWEDQPDPLFYITARFNRAMENMVRQAPDQYLWLHRRWKSRPKFERQSLEFPAKLRTKLESLPWMTQDMLDQILENSRKDTLELAAGAA